MAPWAQQGRAGERRSGRTRFSPGRSDIFFALVLFPYKLFPYFPTSLLSAVDLD